MLSDLIGGWMDVIVIRSNARSVVVCSAQVLKFLLLLTLCSLAVRFRVDLSWQNAIRPKRTFVPNLQSSIRGVYCVASRGEISNAHSLGLRRGTANDLLDTKLSQLGLQLIQLLCEIILALSPELTSLDLGRLWKIESACHSHDHIFILGTVAVHTMVGGILSNG